MDAGMGTFGGVLARIRVVRRRMVWVRAAEGGLRGLAFMLGLGSAALVLDYLFEFSRAVRLALLVGELAWVGWMVWRWLIRPLCAVPRGEAMALEVERLEPGLRSRLISALQLGRETPSSPEAAAFVGRLLEASGQWGSRVDPVLLVRSDRVRRVSVWAVPVALAVAALFLWAMPVSGILLRRALLEEVALPRRTRIVRLEVPEVVGRGEDVRIVVQVAGVVPALGVLRVTQDSGRTQEYPMDPDSSGEGAFGRTLAAVPASFRLRVQVHDALSEERSVEVLPRPVVTNLVLQEVLPAYTGLSPRRVVPGELSLLRGSRLLIQASASQPLREARVRLAGTEGLVPLEVATDGLSVQGAVPVDDPKLHGLSVELVDRRGITSRDPAVYAVNVVEDGVPQVRVLVPSRREELVTTRGTLLVAMEAKDDFGLGALRLRHQPAGAAGGEAAVVELDLAGETNAVVRRRFEWRLGGIQPPLSEGGLHEFWVEAEDRNTVAGPQMGRSERYLLRVVSEAEKRADLLGRAGDAIARLGEVAQGQERLNESLGRIILTRPASP